VSRRYSSFVNARPTAAKPTKNRRGNAQTSGYANPGPANPATDTGASALTGWGVDCVTVVVVDVDVEGNVPRPEPPVNVPPPEPVKDPLELEPDDEAGGGAVVPVPCPPWCCGEPAVVTDAVTGGVVFEFFVVA